MHLPVKEYFEIIKDRIRTNQSEMLWFLSGQVITLIVGFLIIKFISKVGTEDYGTYSLILTIAFLLTSVLFGPAQQGFTRFFYYFAEKGSSHNYKNMMIRFISKSVVVLLLLTAVIVSSSYKFGMDEISFLILYAGIFLIFMKSSEFFNASLNILRKRKVNSIIQSIEKLSSLLGLFLLLKYSAISLFNILIFFSILYLIFSFIKYFYFRKPIVQISEDDNLNPLLQTQMKKETFIYSLPFITWGIASWLQLNGEKWIIAEILSTSDVGIYAIMISLISMMIGIPNTILNEFSSPIIFQQFADLNNNEKIRNGFNYIRILILLVVVLTFAAIVVSLTGGKFLILLISSEDYATYYHLLPLIALGTGLFLAGQNMATIGLALNQPKVYIMPKILIGGLSFLLNIILIKFFGLPGAAYTVVITGILYFVYIFKINKRLTAQIQY